MLEKKIIRPGAAKPLPFTICIVANPVLGEDGQLARDPIVSDRARFDAAVAYVTRALFGALPGQRERMLGDPAFAEAVRIVSIFDDGAADCLVEYYYSLLSPRRESFAPFLARYGETADVAFAVTASAKRERSASLFTSDDETRDGVAFTVGRRRLVHRKYTRTPGTVALHVKASSLTALHEFQHAVSSYANGTLIDLYADASPEDAAASVNCRAGEPPPPALFDTMNGREYRTARDRLGKPYPAGWRSYHCERVNAGLPAVMDDYWQASALGGTPEQCENDAITRQFLRDRIAAKLSR